MSERPFAELLLRLDKLIKPETSWTADTWDFVPRTEFAQIVRQALLDEVIVDYEAAGLLDWAIMDWDELELGERDHQRRLL